MIEPNAFINGDCMDYMKEYPDNYFDLAIVDPPYGDAGGGGTHLANGRRKGQKPPIWAREKVRTEIRQVQVPFLDASPQKPEGEDGPQVFRTRGGGLKNSVKKIISWDVAPKEEYFRELFRISRNQIIWGGNYFMLPPSRCFLIWRKTNIPIKGFSMAPCEYAWTSFKQNAAVFEHTSIRDKTSGKFHPTEKPIALYKWLLSKYAKEGDVILDTHVGSASSLIACREMGFSYVGFELDADYYIKAKERMEQVGTQTNIFDFRNEEKH